MATLAGLLADQGIDLESLVRQAMHGLGPQAGLSHEAYEPIEPQKGLVMQFKVTLKEIDPPIWRRIQVPDCTLDVFSDVLLEAMGWENYHLHQFIIDGELFGSIDDDEAMFDDEIEDESTVLLSEFLPEGRKRLRFTYEYDFGDGWQHDIVLERVLSREKGVRYPQCVEGQRACPPEDVGGPWGYEEYLEAITNPKDEEHESMLEWRGPFDPEAFDPAKTTKRMRRAFKRR
jgi:hypothetical protein